MDKMTGENSIDIKKMLSDKFSDIQFADGHVQNFSNVDSEYEKLVYGIGLRILTDKSIFRMDGRDVLDFLHRVSTNEILSLKVNEKTNTLFTNEKGRLVDRTCLVNLNDHQLLIGNSVHKEILNRWIEKYIIMEDIKINNVDDDYCIIEVLGPQTDSYMTLICGKCVDELNEKSVLTSYLDDIPLKVMKFKEVNGQYKFWILLDKKNLSKFVDNIQNQSPVFNYGFVGLEAYSSYRIEQGIPGAPNEINHHFNPYDVNLLSEVSFTKGCYIGQEVIARIHTYDKAQKELIGIVLHDNIELNGEPIPLQMEPNTDAGFITSATLSKKVNGILGLTVMKKKYIDFEKEIEFKNDSKNLKMSFKKLPV